MNKKNLSNVLFLLVCVPGIAQKNFNITITNNSKISKNNEPIVLNLRNYNAGDVKSALVKCEGEEIPCQLDDLDQDGKMDELCFITDIDKKSSKKVNVTLYNEGKLKDYTSQVYVEMLLSNKK